MSRVPAGVAGLATPPAYNAGDFPPGKDRAPVDITAFVIGLLTGLLMAAIAWVLGLRQGRQAGHGEGRQSREAELVALAGERDAARHELALAGRDLERARAQVEELRRHAERLAAERAAFQARSERVTTLEAELLALRDQHARALQAVAESRARNQEQQEAMAARLRELESARERMKAEFQSLANEILEEKARRFSERNSEQLGHLLNPLREQLGDFRKAVSEAYEKENMARAALQTQVQQLRELNQRLNEEARALTRALSAESRSQGHWGELKLERLLEMAGLEKGQQYLTQESFRDADGDTYRPDAVLKLPGGRDIIIDAKVALTDYQRACATADENERERHLGQHVAALRRHVVQLGQKDYSRLEGLNSPDLVFMFVPVEGAFLEALRREPSLYDDAHRRRIILVGPSNLLASLRLVAQIWRTEDQNRNAQLIAEKAGALYDKFVGFVEDLQKVGDHLDKAARAQQAALGKLAIGRGNLVRRAEELRRLGAASSKQLPAGLTGISDSDDGPEGGVP